MTLDMLEERWLPGQLTWGSPRKCCTKHDLTLDRGMDGWLVCLFVWNQPQPRPNSPFLCFSHILIFCLFMFFFRDVILLN